MASINAMLKQIDREMERVEREIEQLFKDYPTLRRQRELLISIPGIAETTAARILGEMPNITEFRDVKAVAAYAGLSPRHYQSGSIEYRSRLAKTGNAHLRRALYYPALTAIQHNPPIREFAKRLRARGKAKMTVCGWRRKRAEIRRRGETATTLVSVVYSSCRRSSRAVERVDEPSANRELRSWSSSTLSTAAA
jgi:transposase